MKKIKIEHLTFTYPTRKTPSIFDINITIGAGEFVTVCGKSGCGKSTLLRQLKPMLMPHGEKSGIIYFGDNDILTLSQKEQAENIGFVMQNPDNQIVCDKVWHELAFGLESLSYQNAEIRAKVAEMAAFFGIQSWYYKNVSELSGGQKQLLNLASVMVLGPSVLILDEPTSQLDPIAAHDFLDTVSKINKELGTTVILSEHRLEEALPMSDRVIVMDSGKVIADGDVKTVGNILNETDNDMLDALPTPMRVYYSLKSDGNVPVTVRDGREWLLNTPTNKDIVFCENEDFANEKTVLKIDNVYLKYEKDAPDVLKGLSLEIHENEFYALVGGNGAGKSTLISAIMDIIVPRRGTIKISEGKKTAALLQNPQSLFSEKTVLLELCEMIKESGYTEEIKNQKLQDIIRFCDLSDLLESHPYDLSGGEQERCALAKVLLSEPDILLLDEPTKGLDVHFKQKLAKMLKKLQKNGVTVIMISHDIEFCAKYADRIGMMFDGQIVSEDRPRKFFAGKNFYTTQANRMARAILPSAVLSEDIISAIGGRQRIKDDSDSEFILPNKEKKNYDILQKNGEEKKIKNIITGIIFLILFGISECFFAEKGNNTVEYLRKFISIFFLGISLYNIIPKKEYSIFKEYAKESKRKLSKRTIIAVVLIILLMPLTIFIGLKYLDNKKYYFISLLIIVEAMLPFALLFEGRKPEARELVIISVLCAIAVSGRVAFFMLPQFKPVVAIVIISGICFGAETGFLVGAITGFVSNFYFMQGPWTPWQMFSMGIIGALAGILFQKGLIRKAKIDICLFGFFATLIVYGAIMNFASVAVAQNNITIEMFLSSIALGFPMDLIHSVSTVFFLWFALEPMCDKLERVKIKYGLIQ